MIIGNIGVGLFILILLWMLALIIFVVGIKFQNNIAWISLISATAVTVVLLLIPIENSDDSLENNKDVVKDNLFIYKSFLLSVLILSVFLGFVCFFILHCIESVRPRGIKRLYIS